MCTHASATVYKVFFCYLGEELLQGAGEGTFGKGAVHLAHACFPVLHGNLLEAGPGERGGKFAQIDLAFAVALTAKGQYGIGSCFHTAFHHAGEVHTEEGEGRVGHGIDEIAHEALTLRTQLVVFSTEGDDAQVEVGNGEGSNAVAPQPGAIDDQLGLEVSLVAGDDAFFLTQLNVKDFVVEFDLTTGFGDLLAVLEGDFLVVDDTRLGDKHAFETRYMGFVLL